MNKTTTINRPLVGIFALTCLIVGGFLMWRFSTDLEGWGKWSAPFMRVGVLMAALWLALPAKGREAAWADVSPLTLIGLALAVFGIVWRPKVAIPLVIVLGVIGFVLKPRNRNGRRHPPRR